MRKIKPFEDLTFHDDFMFGLVMQDKEICREALECLLGIKIDRLEYIEPQKTIVPVYTSHGIRLDVYVNDGNKVYDELRESIIIFLCRFDPFKKGIPWSYDICQEQTPDSIVLRCQLFTRNL